MKNKIIFFDSYSDASGGAPKSMLVLASLLQEKNYNITIITSKNGKLIELANKNNINCKSSDIPQHLMKRRSSIKKNLFSPFLYFIYLLKFWLSITLGKKKRLFLANYFCINDIRCFLLYLPILLLNKDKIIWYVRINDRVKIITKIAIKLSRKIVLVSDSCYSLFTSQEIRKYGNKIETIYTGFDIPLLKKNSYCTDKNSITISFIGVISRRKNIELLINSISLLSTEIRDRVIINVIGCCKDDDTSYLTEIKEKITKLNLNNSFKFWGHQHDLEPFYLKSDFVILTSYQEGLPRVILEALSYGLYCVSTNVDGINEIITNNTLGSILKKYDPKELAERIKITIDNIELINSEDNINIRKQYIQKKFSKDIFVSKFISCLKSI
ncbi:glycosyltransferase [Providencia sp. PROV152]|nr:glycosyltransferase [Providencia sp. PROV152]